MHKCLFGLLGLRTYILGVPSTQMRIRLGYNKHEVTIYKNHLIYYYYFIYVSNLID